MGLLPEADVGVVAAPARQAEVRPVVVREVAPGQAPRQEVPHRRALVARPLVAAATVPQQQAVRLATTSATAMAAAIPVMAPVVPAAANIITTMAMGALLSESFTDFYSEACGNVSNDAWRCPRGCGCVSATAGFGPASSRLSDHADPDVLPRGEP